MVMKDTRGESVIELERPLKVCSGYCCMCCYPSCTQALSVSSGGQHLGVVEEVPRWWSQKLTVTNPGGELLYNITGPCWTCSCGTDITFEISDFDDTAVGTVTRVWRGCGAEAFTDSDNFRLDLDQAVGNEDKALLLGATFLIDFMYFEKQ